MLECTSGVWSDVEEWWVGQRVGIRWAVAPRGTVRENHVNRDAGKGSILTISRFDEKFQNLVLKGDCVPLSNLPSCRVLLLITGSRPCFLQWGGTFRDPTPGISDG